MTRVPVVGFLRNRRFALWLIAVVVIMSFVGTLPGVGRDFFKSPWFIAPVALLAASTAACAWERTRTSLRLAKDPGGVSDALLSKLRERPERVVEAAALDSDQAAAALRGMGLRVRQGPKLVVGYAGRAGLIGSPLFHWALVMLFLFVVLGKATQSSGLLGAPHGVKVPEVAESYGRLQTGPLFAGHTGYGITVVDWDRSYIIDGVERGPVPTVRVDAGGSPLAEQPVYANRPLRVGSMLLHMNDWGLASKVSIESTSTGELASETVLMDFTDGSRASVAPASLEYRDDEGQIWSITIELQQPDRPVRSRPTSVTADALVSVARQGEVGTAPQRLFEGDSLVLPSGHLFTYEGTTFYARLSIVRDWSLYPIYLSLVVLCIGLMFALLVPYRSASVLLVDTPSGTVAHIVTTHVRRDPVFAQRVVDELLEITSDKGVES